MENVLAILLAGGAGERLSPLTRHTAKPAVPFGGAYQIVDFTLSNILNSGIRRVFILTQYKSLELTRHIREGFSILSPEMGEFIEAIPPMKRVHEDWYLGTADAVYQNLQSVESEAPAQTIILSGDHIYKMNYHEMLESHRKNNATVTIATIQVAPEEAGRFGITKLRPDCRVVGFEEKPQHGNPARSIFNPDMVSASMGIYIFDTGVLTPAVQEDAALPDSSHDFGKDVLPRLLKTERVFAYDFVDLNAKTVRYWRDVGTLEAYYEANMDLVQVDPDFNLYDRRWPIRTALVQAPPAKFVFAQEGRRMGVALDSIVSAGCIISGGRVVNSILSPGVRIHSYCEVSNSIIMSNSQVHRHARLQRTIIGPNVTIPEKSSIGFDPEQDRASGYHVTDSGIVVVVNAD